MGRTLSRRNTGLALIAGLITAQAGTTACSGVAAVAVTSVNATLGEVKIAYDSGTFTGLVLGFGVIDVFLTVAVVVGDLELVQWLDDHRRDIRIELARGDGMFGRRLAAIMDLDANEQGRLRRALQKARSDLDGVLGESGPIDSGRAQRFFQRVAAAIATAEGLEARARAAIKTWPLIHVGPVGAPDT